MPTVGGGSRQLEQAKPSAQQNLPTSQLITVRGRRLLEQAKPSALKKLPKSQSNAIVLLRWKTRGTHHSLHHHAAQAA